MDRDEAKRDVRRERVDLEAAAFRALSGAIDEVEAPPASLAVGAIGAHDSGIRDRTDTRQEHERIFDRVALGTLHRARERRAGVHLEDEVVHDVALPELQRAVCEHRATLHRDPDEVRPRRHAGVMEHVRIRGDRARRGSLHRAWEEVVRQPVTLHVRARIEEAVSGVNRVDIQAPEANAQRLLVLGAHEASVQLRAVNADVARIVTALQLDLDALGARLDVQPAR